MKDGFWMLLCSACLLLSAQSVQARGLTALDIFAQLPITLFENTPEGLSEEEKLRLIEQGESEFWEVERFDADRLVLVSRPFGETRVGLRVFRGRGIGCLLHWGRTGAPCVPLELWQEDAIRWVRARPNPPDDSAAFRLFWIRGSGSRRMCLRRSCSALKMTGWTRARSSGGLRASSMCLWASPCVMSGSRGRLEKTVSDRPE